MIDLTDLNFYSTIANGKWIVDFKASWCGPCRSIAPKFKDLENQLGNKLNFAKVDIDDNASVTNDMNVSSIPTFILFKDGKEEARWVGMFNENEIKKHI